jgi:ferredoxin
LVIKTINHIAEHLGTVCKMGLRTDLVLRLIKRSFNSRFTLAKLTRIPMVGAAMDFALFEDDDIIILPKDSVYERTKNRTKTIDLNFTVERESIVLPSQVIDHFIDRSRYIFLMNKCICRDSNQCQHYPATLGCIFLGKGTKRISSKRGRMVTKEEAKAHMRRCREAGLVHLIGRDKIDSVVFNTGAKEDLLSICSCCPCCCLWKMVPDLSSKISSTLTRMPGVEVVVHADRCKGCGRCVKENICYVRALYLRDGKASIDATLCKGCARCVEHCPHGAMELVITDDRFIEESIKRLEPLVDIDAE